MSIENILKELTFYIGDTTLDCTERTTFFQFVHHLVSSGKARFIYRGESNLNEQFNTDTTNIRLLSDYIFVIGEKGRRFLKDHNKKYDNIFEFIWDKFHAKVCGLRFSSIETKKRVKCFLDGNQNFIEYFCDQNNHNDFISRLAKEKKEVADYYLAILHTIGKSGNSHSYFLSSSEDISIANKFRGNDNNAIVLYGWIPKKGWKKKIISYNDMNIYDEVINQLGLPTYQTPMYMEQKEICLKCGLLPHFIIGFQHNEKFYINPNILNNEWCEDIIYNGLCVDQSHFGETFEKTNYKISYVFCNGEYNIIIDNDICNI